jgi:transposase
MSDHRTVVVADHHKSVFVCQVLDRETGAIEKRTLKSCRSELEPFLERLAGPVLVFVEACRAWEWVSDLCEDLGVDLKLVDPAKMPEISRSTKKTDQHDVAAMLQRLLSVGELPESYRASRSERELRGLTRQLSDLRHARRDLCNRIHALIDSRGWPAKKKSFEKAEWRSEMEKSLSKDWWLVLESLLLQLDMVSVLKRRLEQTVGERMKGRGDYERLAAIPGIGPVLGATILAESAGIARFKKARHFAAYTGLVPRVRSSAGKARLGRITRAGPADLRWALGQAVIIASRAKQSTEVSRMYRRKRERGKAGKLAVCAAAHKLARIVYVLLTRNEVFNPNPRRRAAA